MEEVRIVKHNIEAEYEIAVRDKEGRVIEHRRRRSDSFFKNFPMLISAGGDRVATWCRDGSMSGYGGLAIRAGESDNSYGIQVGTSDPAVTANDFKLEAQIAHGIKAGQLYHYSTLMDNPVVSGNTAKQKISREFWNNSGDDIVIMEMGLVGKRSEDRLSSFMIVHDVIAPVTVPPGGRLDASIIMNTVG